MTKIKCNAFVTRQTAESPFSYLDNGAGGTADWRSLEVFTEECVDDPGRLNAAIGDGYKPGVKLVTISYCDIGVLRFYTGVVKVTHETPLRARFMERRAGEEPFLEVFATGPKVPAAAVELVLYSRDLLRAEGEKVDDDVDYEIVSINARTTLAIAEPMTPIAMMRNMLALPGGTPATYTAEQFCASIHYWSQRAMRDPGV